MAAACPAFPANGPVLAGELSPAERERLIGRHRRPRHRFCRPGAGAAVDHAGVGPGPHRAAAVRAAGLRRRDARRLDDHARRLLPDRRAARRPRGLDGRRRPRRRRLGGLRQGGVGLDAAAGRRHRAHPPHRRRAAEPRRRQSVLARPLSRARRGDAAADPRARHAAARSRQGRAAALQHAAERIQRLLVAWGAVSQTSRTQPAKVAAEALQSEERFGSALSLVRSAQRTASSLARAAVAGRLAGHHRNERAARRGGRRR